MSDNTQNFSTRVPKDTAESIEEYREENEFSKSEAVRKLATSGLEYERWGGRDRREELERKLSKLEERNNQLNARVEDFRRTHSHPGDDIARGGMWLAMALFFATIVVSFTWDFGGAPIPSGAFLVASVAVGIGVVLTKIVTYILKFTGWRLSDRFSFLESAPATTDRIEIEEPVQE